MARPDGWAAPEVPMRAHLLPPAQPGLQEVVCVLADGPLRHSVRTNSQEGAKSSSGLLGTGYADPLVVRWSSGSRPGAQGPGGVAASSHPRPMGLSSEPGCPESRLPPRVQPAPYTDRLGTLGPFGDGLLGQPRLLFQAKSFQPRQGPSDSRARRFSEGPSRQSEGQAARQLAPSQRSDQSGEGSGGARSREAAPPRRSGHPSAVARLLLHPAHFPQQLGTTVPWGVPAGPGRQAPPASPAQAAPRPGRLHPAEAAGARRFPCDRPVQGGPRRARGYSPQQVRLPG
ncbi:hypothetical protein NDU88_006590 [Pleurodeles waltl]|uniref:Uncharacterized protein n=1 Tax=Pleurodeles waltl TaxID=8319 RepID=A0AAV7QPD9_PLEWA|nr:hypothetical protein NDU88_006590 [Pleurodeles waltl]